jgi:hypothetical protein
MRLFVHADPFEKRFAQQIPFRLVHSASRSIMIWQKARLLAETYFRSASKARSLSSYELPGNPESPSESNIGITLHAAIIARVAVTFISFSPEPAHWRPNVHDACSSALQTCSFAGERERNFGAST